MFCYQCEQTPGGCVKRGVCGKDAPTAVSQDLLIDVVKDMSQYAAAARQFGASDDAIDKFPVDALFATLTNVNFDEKRIMEYVQTGLDLKDKAKKMYENAAKKNNVTPQQFTSTAIDWKKPLADWNKYSIKHRQEQFGNAVAGVQELIVYGLKGVAAYYEHSSRLTGLDDKTSGFIHEALAFLNTPKAGDMGELLGTALKVGEINLHVLGLLDKAHNDVFGHPSPTNVRTTPVKGKSILVSGHDMLDIKNILEAAQAKGVNVYTHGEMLPAHGYPELRKYKNLAGHYGTAWQNQKTQFSEFPGPIVMTTNCLMEPLSSYSDRIYSVGVVGSKNVKHLKDRNWDVVVDKALECKGFAETATETNPLLTGCGHHAVLSLAPVVIDAIKAGKISRFFLIGGCDGSGDSRSYYRELAKALPNSAVALTLGCAKYRINDLPWGTVADTGIPRLLDCGQCNDSYSAIQIALALSSALDTPVNSLPLSFAVSWFEQKAVAVLLSLLHLGIENIHIGPELPAFLEPEVLGVLNDKFKLVQISDDFKKDFNL
jgi:hydroxylamine reductase